MKTLMSAIGYVVTGIGIFFACGLAFSIIPFSMKFSPDIVNICGNVGSISGLAVFIVFNLLNMSQKKG